MDEVRSFDWCFGENNTGLEPAVISAHFMSWLWQASTSTCVGFACANLFSCDVFELLYISQQNRRLTARPDSRHRSEEQADGHEIVMGMR